jgi:tryptophan synthase alpha chain
VETLRKSFEELRARGEKALMPFFTIGYPNMKKSLELIEAAAGAGADIIEIGIPFSDPIADGPVIQYSSQESLKSGTTLSLALESLRTIAGNIEASLVLMTYYNPVLAMGLEKFTRSAAEVPVSGVIIPDLPPEEGGGLEPLLRQAGIDMIYLAAPTSKEDRIRMITERSSGFVYAVSVTGVTGARKDLPEELSSFLASLRKVTSKPVCVGFGISTREHAELLAPQADGVIIGSAIVEIIRNNQSDPVGAISEYLKEIKAALKG